MLAKRIIPCLDIKNGRVVKGVNFVGLKDAGDPVEIAKKYNEEGADELTFLDITATLEARDTLIDLVARIAAEISIPFTVGGGIRSCADISRILNAGADKVSLNSAIVKNPDLINESAAQFGSQCIIAAIDAKQESDGSFQVYVAGGTQATGLDAIEWAKEVVARGAGEILVTSMDRDGTKSGFDLELTRRIAEAVSVPVIASGGAGKLEDFYDGIIRAKADAVLAAGLFHFNQITIPNLKNYLALRGIPVRTADENVILPDSVTLPAVPFSAFKTDANGLVPAIIRDKKSGDVLMMAYLNETAWNDCLRTGLMNYYSRSRKTQWLKGETSGHFQQIRAVRVDCDADTLLIDVFQLGAACHTGEFSCFYRDLNRFNAENFAKN